MLEKAVEKLYDINFDLFTGFPLFSWNQSFAFISVVLFSIPPSFLSRIRILQNKFICKENCLRETNV